MSDERRLNRRGFFTKGLQEFLKPLAEQIAPLEETLRQLKVMPSETEARKEAIHAQLRTPLPPGVWLRPPGAISEETFNDVCSKCAKCVEVCPVDAIRLDPAGVAGGGAPFIDPNLAACVACDGIQCTAVCPTGALMPITLPMINMGTALWDEQTCVRTRGESCSLCVDQCPVGEFAIKLDGPKVVVKEDGCIGCGTCQKVCPTIPKSIVVIPKREYERRKNDPRVKRTK